MYFWSLFAIEKAWVLITLWYSASEHQVFHILFYKTMQPAIPIRIKTQKCHSFAIMPIFYFHCPWKRYGTFCNGHVTEDKSISLSHTLLAHESNKRSSVLKRSVDQLYTAKWVLFDKADVEQHIVNVVCVLHRLGPLPSLCMLCKIITSVSTVNGNLFSHWYISLFIIMCTIDGHPMSTSKCCHSINTRIYWPYLCFPTPYNSPTSIYAY